MADKDQHGKSKNTDVGMSVSASHRSVRRSEETVLGWTWGSSPYRTSSGKLQARPAEKSYNLGIAIRTVGWSSGSDCLAAVVAGSYATS